MISDLSTLMISALIIRCHSLNPPRRLRAGGLSAESSVNVVPEFKEYDFMDRAVFESAVRELPRKGGDFEFIISLQFERFPTANVELTLEGRFGAISNA